MITPADVTACLVTGGDQPEMMTRIRENLIFDSIAVWNNSQRPKDWKTAGRYAVLPEAERSIVYFQDDDVIVPPETQQALVDAYEPGVLVANWGHGDTPDGYDDLALVGAGAIVDRDLPWVALHRYLEHFPEDDGFRYEADFIAGLLTPHKHLRLPFHIELEVAQHPSRLCNQPWQGDLKLKITNQARSLTRMAA